MGCATSNTRYRRISDPSASGDDNGILLEIGRGGTRGRYWFRFELPEVLATKAPPEEAEPKAPAIAIAPEEIKHRYFERSKSALKSAQETLADFRETRYQKWQEMSRDTTFSLFRRASSGEFIATCSTEGVFAHEVAFEFWNTDESSKLEWDTSIETSKVLESVTPSCSILHIITKTVWPLKARDVVICTEMMRVAHGTYAVCNYSLNEYTSPLISEGNYLRANTSIILIVEQHLKDPEGDVSRNNIQSQIFYQADIDPGGWVPSNLVKTLSRREWKSTLTSLCKNAHKRIQKEALREQNSGYDEDDELFFDSHEQYVIDV